MGNIRVGKKSNISVILKFLFMAHALSFTLLPALTFLLLSRTKRRFKSAKVSWARIQRIRMNDFQPLHHGYNLTVQESFPTKSFVHTTAKILCRACKLEKNQNLLGAR